MKLICFDLEGPLAPQDNAYELMKLFPTGGKTFEVISRYDDLATLEGRKDYEPGDTLALTAPFLAYHGITEEQITAMGQESRLTSGALELISRLKSVKWQIFCISTSYEQYALSVTQRLGIASQNVACTHFPLDRIRQLLSNRDFALLRQAEERMATLSDDAEIKQHLDRFYQRDLARTSSGRILAEVKPVGGRRKVEALEDFASVTAKPLSQWVVVGDSITDARMLQAVDRAGGLAIAFNANEYVLPYCTISLASTRLDDLWGVLEVWQTGKRRAVELAVRKSEASGGREDRGWFHWMSGSKDISHTLDIHRRIRVLVRHEAAKLG